LRYTDSDARIARELTALLGRADTSQTETHAKASLSWPGLVIQLDYTIAGNPAIARVNATAKSYGQISIRTLSGISVGQKYGSYSLNSFCVPHFVTDVTSEGGVFVLGSIGRDRIRGIEAPTVSIPC
jgi:hypothetical protein